MPEKPVDYLEVLLFIFNTKKHPVKDAILLFFEENLCFHL